MNISVKKHYDHHLAKYYAWMTGDIKSKQEEFEAFLIRQQLKPLSTGVAIDLGAGNGLQSIPLARIGYSVHAVDFSKDLLEELEGLAKGLDVKIWNSDIRNVERFTEQPPELIICCGDTLAHLDSWQEVTDLISKISVLLDKSGKCLFSFRDYSTELTGNSRFIPVRSDKDRIMTCFLQYEKEHVQVTDLIYEREGNEWKQKVSSYRKVRLTTDEILRLLENNGFYIAFEEVRQGMVTLVAKKLK